MKIEVLEGFVEEAHEPVERSPQGRRRAAAVPPELREADAMLSRYGLWAQDRYRKQRCASAEGRYVPPPMRGQDDETMQPFMPNWNAIKVQHALQVVPMQYRRVLFAVYIPQREHPMAARRRYRIKSATWEASRIEGLRQFWAHYLRRVDKPVHNRANLRDTESCAPVALRQPEA